MVPCVPSPTGSIIHLSILRLQFREDPECLIDRVHFIGEELSEVHVTVHDGPVVELTHAVVVGLPVHCFQVEARLMVEDGGYDLPLDSVGPGTALKLLSYQVPAGHLQVRMQQPQGFPDPGLLLFLLLELALVGLFRGVERSADHFLLLEDHRQHEHYR